MSLIKVGKLYTNKGLYYEKNNFIIKIIERTNELQVLIEYIKHPEEPKGYSHYISVHTLQEHFIQLSDDETLSILYADR